MEPLSLHPSILIVDDSLVERNLYVHMVRKWGYVVDVAVDGDTALEKIKTQNIQLVLADWQMPGMNGTELCSKVRALNFDRYIYIILMSAQREEAFLISALEAGADDVLAKPVDTNELEARLHSAVRRLGLQASLAQQNERISKAHDLMAMDLGRVSQVQRSFLPEPVSRFNDLSYHWISVPSQYVSGDHLNIFPLNADTYGFYILDVSGHGIPAAVKSMQLVQMFSDLSSTSVVFEPVAYGKSPNLRLVSKPRDVVSRLNRMFQQTDSDLSYFTLIYGLFKPSTGEVTLCQAGHPPPIVFRNDGEVEVVGAGGYPVGLFEHDEFEDIQFTMQTGEALFLYSDGLTEVLSAEVEQFGEQRLIQFLTEKRKQHTLAELPPLIREELVAWGGESLQTQGFEDDLSILLFGRPHEKVEGEMAELASEQKRTITDERVEPNLAAIDRPQATFNVEREFFDPVRTVEKKASIVIADDSRSFLRIFEAMLTSWGYQVYSAQSGHEAATLIEAHQPDFVLTDWDMPGMSGIELCEHVRAQRFNRYIYIIMITGYASRDDLLRSLKVGADDFLTKPLNPSELKVRLQTAVRISALHKVLQEKHHELNRVYQSLRRDMREVSRIQRSLLPKSTLSPWPVAVQTLYSPSEYVCGEQLGTLKTQENEMGFLSISLPGQGTSTALQAMAYLRWFSMARATQMLFPVDGASTRIRRYLAEPSKVLHQLVDFTPTFNNEHSDFDLLYGLLNLDQGTLLVAGIGRWVLVLIHPDHQVEIRRSLSHLEGSSARPMGVLHEDVIKPGTRFFVCSEMCLESLGLMNESAWQTLTVDDQGHAQSLSTQMSLLTGLTQRINPLDESNATEGARLLESSAALIGALEFPSATLAHRKADIALMGFQWREPSPLESVGLEKSLMTEWMTRASRLAEVGSDSLKEATETIDLGFFKDAIAYRAISDTSTIGEIGVYVREFLEQLKYVDTLVYSAELVISEAMTNVMYHGFKMTKPEALCLVVLAFQNAVVILIDDTGTQIPAGVLAHIRNNMDYLDGLTVSELPEGGMGLTFIRMAAERFSYSRQNGVNRLELLLVNPAAEEQEPGQLQP
ncbi:MAG: response regulator [Limnobacter sp.]|nr:response regulator [Limnobacter sp.]